MSFESQDAAIEKLLRSRYGEWIACYELPALALQYSRAIHSIRKRLREAGDYERVENRHPRVNGKVHGSFRIARTADIIAESSVKPVDPPGEPSPFEKAHRADLERETPLFAEVMDAYGRGLLSIAPRDLGTRPRWPHVDHRSPGLYLHRYAS
jgi:hypothetical protein